MYSSTFVLWHAEVLQPTLYCIFDESIAWGEAEVRGRHTSELGMQVQVHSSTVQLDGQTKILFIYHNHVRTSWTRVRIMLESDGAFNVPTFVNIIKP